MSTYRKNQYTGVNAHANSWLQTHGMWRSFHGSHITHLADTLNTVLKPGYIAVPEDSLQVTSTTPGEGDEGDVVDKQRPIPDVGILDKHFRDNTAPSTDLQPAGIVTPTIETMDIEELELRAAVIYEVAEKGKLGRPVTRIEVLSPTNKPPYSDYAAYQHNRNNALRSGVPLVEIDYVHQQPSVNKLLPDYPDEETSHPYSITVHDPRPSVYAGKTMTIPFDVDQPIPKFDIPLNQGERLEDFDLGAVYNHTFEVSPLLYEQADYDIFPENLDSYSRTDRIRIGDRVRMVQHLEEAGSKLNKEGPFPIDYNLIGRNDIDPLDFIASVDVEAQDIEERDNGPDSAHPDMER